MKFFNGDEVFLLDVEEFGTIKSVNFPQLYLFDCDVKRDELSIGSFGEVDSVTATYNISKRDGSIVRNIEEEKIIFLQAHRSNRFDKILNKNK